MKKTLTVATTVKVDKEVNREIELPYFYANQYGQYVMINEKKETIAVRRINGITSVSYDTSVSKYALEDIVSGQQITKEQFMEVFTKAHTILSQLNPSL